MRKTSVRRTIAALLVWLQISVLLVCAAPRAYAADAKALPVRNPVRERVLRFGSFGFTGDLEHQRDGIDYVLPYYYSDDFFAPSAVNPNATRKVMDFSDLENVSMATLTKAFALAICSSAENSVPADFSHKSKNGEQFFSDCGFKNVFVSPDFNKQTGKDTLGYMIASKPVTVWDTRTQTNRSFTLVAVGVRGGGYGAEWASNLTIGDPNSAAASGTYRHKGFSDGAAMVLRDLDAYLKDNRITGDVKYWVTGYSRSGAVANLAAGAITDAAAKYRTTRDDVYCYTYECAAGALASEDPDGTRYPNIHNILNAMDLVPRISPRAFGHGRLGVDYRMPFYANTTPEQNETYYARMRTVLPLVAAIPDIYNGAVTGIEGDPTADAVITDSDPAVYPYDRPVQIKSFQITNLLSGGLTQPVANENSHIAPAGGLMFDAFLDQFVDHFVTSRAWDAAFLKPEGLGWSSEDMTFDPMSHEQQYVKIYQAGMRDLAGALFKTPGMGFKSLGGAMDNITKALDLEALWNGLGLATHYSALSLGSPRYNYHVHEMIDPAATLVNKIVDVSGIFGEEDLPEVREAVKKLMPALIWLFCEDRVKNDGEYLGTLADNFSTIFVTHIPEMAVSWLMSLDDVYTSDYRTVTVPKATNITVREFREAYGETPSMTGDAPIIARVENGAVRASLDDRISVWTGTALDDSGKLVETVTIRYPGDLEARFDVTAAQGKSYADLYLKLDDLAPKETVNVRAICVRDDRGHITSDGIERLLTPDTTQSAKAVNADAASTALALGTRDTLRILASHGSNLPGSEAESTYAMELAARGPKPVWRDLAEGLRDRMDGVFAGLGKW